MEEDSMSKKTALWAGVMALVLVAPQARAAAKEWSINFNGGVAAPMGDFKDAAKLGFMGGVGADYTVTPNVALGVDGSFISNSGSDDFNAALTALAGSPTTAKFSMLQGGAHMKYLFPMASESSISPYFIGGLGIYNVKNKVESTDPLLNGEVSSSKVGARGGFGLNYKTSPKVSIGLESAYHWINTKDSSTGAPSTAFISLQAGVTVGMGNPASN
jgi:opacity protein-like surface antigen